ncbi:hypothetical protein MRX96_036694 [Rhipicephalus microplus]
MTEPLVVRPVDSGERTVERKVGATGPKTRRLFALSRTSRGEQRSEGKQSRGRAFHQKVKRREREVPGSQSEAQGVGRIGSLAHAPRNKHPSAGACAPGTARFLLDDSVSSDQRFLAVTGH